jgi:hypothetical protein
VSRLRDAGLTVKPSKVAIAVQEVSFLGHRVSPVGFRRSLPHRGYQKVLPSERCRRVVLFIGMVSLHSKLIPHFFDVALPLKALTKSGLNSCGVKIKGSSLINGDFATFSSTQG